MLVQVKMHHSDVSLRNIIHFAVHSCKKVDQDSQH